MMSSPRLSFFKSFSFSLALSLLVLGIFADYHDLALAADDFAFFAHGLYGRSDFHFVNLLLASPGDAATGQVIG